MSASRNTKSNIGSSGIASSDAPAGPRTMSTRSSTPAASRFRCAMSAYSSSSSRHVSVPPSAEPASDADRAVARERPDLQRVLRTDRRDQHLHQRTLVGRHLHHRPRHLATSRARPAPAPRPAEPGREVRRASRETGSSSVRGPSAGHDQVERQVGGGAARVAGADVHAASASAPISVAISPPAALPRVDRRSSRRVASADVAVEVDLVDARRSRGSRRRLRSPGCGRTRPPAVTAARERRHRRAGRALRARRARSGREASSARRSRCPAARSTRSLMSLERTAPVRSSDVPTAPDADLLRSRRCSAAAGSPRTRFRRAR